MKKLFENVKKLYERYKAWADTWSTSQLILLSIAVAVAVWASFLIP